MLHGPGKPGIGIEVKKYFLHDRAAAAMFFQLYRFRTGRAKYDSHCGRMSAKREPRKGR